MCMSLVVVSPKSLSVRVDLPKHLVQVCKQTCQKTVCDILLSHSGLVGLGGVDKVQLTVARWPVFVADDVIVDPAVHLSVDSVHAWSPTRQPSGVEVAGERCERQ